MNIDTISSGYGNNIVTKIINLDDISHKIQRDPLEIVTYLSYEIGTSFNNNLELKGKITKGDLIPLLSKYVRDFAMCINCNHLITKYVVKNDNNIYQLCINCNSENINDCKHNIKKYIYEHIAVTNN